ncbi:hypothetical protein [Tessaracoccus timonensis]|uniref:hypothetical protein n=1 Tax=Tessaracoccus timonensis TaxID=2161816 RepID=UPI000D552F9B|nr:hypothetical protein [Tessaracoccus timonensis]
MSLPNMNPLAAKLLGGRDFREQLRESLLKRARETDDPAYRARLLEVADGKRPLRTLLHDPGFQPELREAAQQMEETPPTIDFEGDAQEVAAKVEDQLASIGVQVPQMEELQAIFPDVVAQQAEAEAIVRSEELTGWGGSVERKGDEGR